MKHAFNYHKSAGTDTADESRAPCLRFIAYARM